MKRTSQRPYDWFGYGVWFGFGALIGGLPLFVFHFAWHTVELGRWQVIGLLSACCLAGGLMWGRKHRRQWERENSAGEMMDDFFGR